MIPAIMAVVFAVVFFMRIRSGWRRGIIREIFSLIKFVLALVCLWMIWLIWNYIQEHDYYKIFLPAGGIGLLSFIFKVVGNMGYTLSGLREAGPIRFVDSLLGAMAGALEGLILLWFMRMALVNLHLLS
ncbi:MAG: CvpA family protein [Lachnospiraceae bacterium]|nr:CvpA family protein [Lachnospiraceae bacterium]